MVKRQSQRLFIEYFSRRLLVAHEKGTRFTCLAHPTTRILTEATKKRSVRDLLQEGITFSNVATDIADIDPEIRVDHRFRLPKKVQQEILHHKQARRNHQLMQSMRIEE